jgi:hypothetical protein
MKKLGAKYVKANVSPDTNQVINILAAEQHKYVYEILDELVRKAYPDYFRKNRC